MGLELVGGGHGQAGTGAPAEGSGDGSMAGLIHVLGEAERQLVDARRRVQALIDGAAELRRKLMGQAAEAAVGGGTPGPPPPA